MATREEAAMAAAVTVEACPAEAATATVAKAVATEGEAAEAKVAAVAAQEAEGCTAQSRPQRACCDPRAKRPSRCT